MKLRGPILAAGAIMAALLMIVMFDVPPRDPKSSEPQGNKSKQSLASVSLPPESSLPQAENTRIGLSPELSMEEIPSKPPQTARAFLADYWGPKWNEVEEAMLKRGVNLDVDFKLGLWEDAFPEIQEKIYLDASEIQNQIDFVLDWPSEVTIEALDAKFPWLSIETEEELEAANSVAAPFNHELTGLGEAWAAQLDFRIREKWSQGGFIRSPYTTIGMKQESGFYSISTGSRGWSVLLTINETDCPEMGELMKQFNAVIASREEALRQQFRR